MPKTKALAILISGLIMAPALMAQAGPAVLLVLRVPEPSFAPDLALCLLGLGITYWFWRRSSTK
jgi:integral membrane sensor domain MASE1